MKTMRFDVTVNFPDDTEAEPTNVQALIVEILLDDGAVSVRVDRTDIPQLPAPRPVAH